MNRLVIDRARPAGFFSDFIWIVSGFAVASERDYVPFVPTTKNACQSGITPHWKWDWSEYFTEPEPHGLAPGGSFEFLDLERHPENVLGAGGLTRLRSAFERYSGLRPDVMALLDSLAIELIRENTLGIHFRSGDMRWAPVHATPPSQTFMLKLIESELRQSKFDSIYVASEDLRFIGAVKRKFPSLIIKSSLDSSNSLGPIVKSLSKISVLTDAYLLGRCAKLMHSPSNVAFAAKFLSSSALTDSLEIRMGLNHPRLPMSVFQGVIAWPIFSHLRSRRAELLLTSRSEWEN